MDPKANYDVYTYVPGLCDKALRGEEYKEELPNVTCTACKATYSQKSILEYNVRDEFSCKVYADLQFHQYGGLCLPCRAPFPGEGHFEESSSSPLGIFLTDVLCVTKLHDIVWEYYNQQELPEYRPMKKEHLGILIEAVNMDEEHRNANLDLIGLYSEVGRSYMRIPGVEHVHLRAEKVDPFYIGNTGEFLELEDNPLPDIKLDYRYWRPKECTCEKTPCECICFPAQVYNIKRILKIPDKYDYRVLGTLPYIDMAVRHRYDKNNRLSFIVYLRDWSTRNPDNEDGNVVETLGWQMGVCRTVYKEEEDEVATVHTHECRRRNAPHATYRCMLEQDRCGRCEDCLGMYYNDEEDI
jgi:hypothetical protein